MKAVKKIITILISLLVVAGALLLLYWIGKTLIDFFLDLQKEVAAGIIAGTVTITISVFSIVLSKYYERKAEVQRYLHDKKVPVYEAFMEFWFSFMFAEKAGRPKPTEHEMVGFLNDFTHKLIIWGSDDVLKSFTAFREAMLSLNVVEGTEKPAMDGEMLVLMLHFENFMFEMRKDLGHKNKKINKADILVLFINDIRKYMP